MTEIRIPDDAVRRAFAEALAMPSDTGSDFFADLRLCLTRTIADLLPAQGIAVRNMDKVGRRGRQIANVRDISPLKHYSPMYKEEYTIDGDFCFGYGFDEHSLGAVNYVCGGKESPSLLPFRTIRGFSIGNLAFNTGEVCDLSTSSEQVFRVAALAWHNGSRKTPGPFLALLGVHFDFDRLQPLLDEVTAALPPNYTALDEAQSCSTPVLWIARDSGGLFTCRCFDGTYTPRNEWAVRDNLCCLCTNSEPRIKCGHKMYFTPFQQKWNPYFPIFRAKLTAQHPERYQRTEDIKTLERDAENALREFIGHPTIGEKWREETNLFRIVKALLAPRNVVHHHKGDELFGLEYDIYVPDLRLAIEYHGAQHFRSVSNWGGAEGLAKRRENDARKRRLSGRHAIDLVEFTYRDQINTETVAARLRPFLERPKPRDAQEAQCNAEADKTLRSDAERGRLRRRERSRTPVLWKPHLEPEQVKLFSTLLEWGRTKIQAQEGFDILAVIQRDTGKSMEKYSLDTVDESLRAAQQQIAADGSIRFYAFAMRCTMEQPDEEQPQTGLMVAIERVGLLSSLFVFCPFQFETTSDVRISVPSSCCRTDMPLLRANRDHNAGGLREMGLGSLLEKPSQ